MHCFRLTRSLFFAMAALFFIAPAAAQTVYPIDTTRINLWGSIYTQPIKDLNSAAPAALGVPGTTSVYRYDVEPICTQDYSIEFTADCTKIAFGEVLSLANGANFLLVSLDGGPPVIVPFDGHTNYVTVPALTNIPPIAGSTNHHFRLLTLQSNPAATVGPIQLTGGREVLTSAARRQAFFADNLGMPYNTAPSGLSPLQKTGTRVMTAFTPTAHNAYVTSQTYGSFVWACDFNGTGLDALGRMDAPTLLLVSVDGNPYYYVTPCLANGQSHIDYFALAWGLPRGTHHLRVYDLSSAIGSNQGVVWWMGVRVQNGAACQQTVPAGATQITLNGPVPANWNAGDWITIDHNTAFSLDVQERRMITAIAGSTLTLNAALTQAHDGSARPFDINDATDPPGTIAPPTGTPVTSLLDLRGVYAPSGKRLCVLGDSIAQGIGETGNPASVNSYSPPLFAIPGIPTYDDRVSFARHACNQLGWELCNLSHQGYATADLLANAGVIAWFNPNGFDVFALEAGTNDVVTHVDVGTFRANYSQLLDKARAVSPNAQFICVGLNALPQYAPYNAAIQDIVQTNLATGWNIRYLDIANNQPPVPLADAKHPTNEGQFIMAAALTQALSPGAASNYTLSLTSEVSTVQQPITFTLALPSGQSLPNGTLVTPQASGVTGVFSPESVTLDSDHPSAAFAFTPATSGAGSIGVTNTADLENPPALTIDVAAPVISGTITLEAFESGTESVLFTFRPTDGGAALTRQVTFAPDGAFSLKDIPAGNYNVAIKGSKWLQTVAPVDTRGGPDTRVTAFLYGGDANNDNVVDLGDAGLLINAFGSSMDDGTGFYDARADFNADGFVDIIDFSLLVNNFGQTGDP